MMNKIILSKEKLFDNDLNIIESNSDVRIIIESNIDILLSIDIDKKIIFDIKKNSTLNIKRIDINKKIDLNVEYYLEQDSKLICNYFLINEFENEIHNIYLNGINSNVDFRIRTISKTNEKYEINVHHLNNYTNSNIILRGVNKCGTINFHVKGIVPKNSVNCIVNQDNRIYTFNDNFCKIEPILLIENNDIIANHSAFIGRFDEEVIFYLMTRGISREMCHYLLIKGFLNIDNDKEIITLIHKYWR